MIKKFIKIAATAIWLPALLTACGSEPDQQVSSMLLKDDLKVCGNDEAIQAVLVVAQSDYLDFLSNGGEAAVVDEITADNLDKEIHEITCNATLHYKTMSTYDYTTLRETEPTTTEKKLAIRYKLRPTLEEGSDSFVAMISSKGKVSFALSRHIDWWNSQQELDQAAENISDTGANEDSNYVYSEPELNSAESSDTEELTNSSNSGGFDYYQLEESSQQWSSSEKADIAKYWELNEDCRGSSDPAISDPACAERDQENSPLVQRFRKANMCVHFIDKPTADSHFHRCRSNSIRF